jgi:hypothetical protein
MDLRVGWINPGTFLATLASQCAGLTKAFQLLSDSRSDSVSASQSSSLLCRLSQSPFQLSPFSVSEMLSGVLFSALSTGWRSILLIQRMFNTWVYSPGRSFVDKAGGKHDLSEHLNAAVRRCWKFVQNALMISSVSERYPTAFVWVFGEHDTFCVACRLWLPCHISKKLWTLVVEPKSLSSASSTIPSHFPFPGYPMLRNCRPIVSFCHLHTSLLRHFPRLSRQCFHTVSSQYHLVQEKYWPTLQHHVV